MGETKPTTNSGAILSTRLGISFRKVVVPNLKLKTHHNCKYSYSDFFKLLTYAGINNGCAEGSANNLNFLSEEGCPNGDTLLYHH